MPDVITLTRMVYCYHFHHLIQNCKVTKTNWGDQALCQYRHCELELSSLSLAELLINSMK